MAGNHLPLGGINKMKDLKISVTRSFSVHIIGERLGRKPYENATVFSSMTAEMPYNTPVKKVDRLSGELRVKVYEQVMAEEERLVGEAYAKVNEELDKTDTPF